MKKVKKLRLNKEVIASLSKTELEHIKGKENKNLNGDTFHSNCMCVTEYEKTCVKYTKLPKGCEVMITLSQVELCCKSKPECINPYTMAGNGCINPITLNCLQASRDYSDCCMSATC